jgi:glycosyltransferase involved in cell wall biosynthesis
LNFPLISVVIPVYNQARYLGEAIESVLHQTYPHIEIIVIDDGSTDEISLLKAHYYSLSHPFSISWIELTNQGPSQARNEGIKRASGSYICLLDSDDRMEAERISMQYQAFIKNPAVSIVYTAVTLIDEQGKVIGEIRGKNYLKEDFLAFMLFRNVMPNPNTTMAKATCFKSYPYNPSFKHAEDYELMTRLAHHFHFYYLDLPLNFYRRHLSNLSNNLRAHREAELLVISRYIASQIE